MATVFICASPTAPAGHFAFVGIPLDRTGSFHRGSADGPRALREASYNLEEYCQVADASLFDLKFADFGDLDCPETTPLDELVDGLDGRLERLFAGGQRPIGIGGEHTVSLPMVRILARKHPGLCVVHFDAHADLRPSYEGEKYSHAAVMHHVSQLVGIKNLFQFGIRSGTREEWALMRGQGTLRDCSPEAMAKVIEAIGQRPVFLSIDLDVLDPSEFPGTGTPEAGGISFKVLDQLVRMLKAVKIVGCDLVELCPPHDPSGISSAAASKLARTILLSL